jgi:transcriptional regulator with XRE-family HTH domain
VIQENMTLEEYLEKNKMSQAKLARRAGMSRAAINRLLSGSRRPSPQTMGKIFVATDGDVAPNDFFRDEMQDL